MVPADWVAAVSFASGAGDWPRVGLVWPELLIPDGWEPSSSAGFTAMLLLDGELLVPPGW